MCLVLGAVLAPGYCVEKTDGVLDLMELSVHGKRAGIAWISSRGRRLGSSCKTDPFNLVLAVMHPYSHPPPPTKDQRQ